MPSSLVRIAAVGLLALAGCSGADSPETETATAATASSTTATPDDPPPPAPNAQEAEPPSTPPAVARDAASVFFSGHSLINLNSPALFAQLARGAGRTVSYQLQMGLGSPMSVRLACQHSGQQADGAEIAYDVLDELQRAGAYDTLILTERSDVLGTILGERSTSMARRYRDAFRAGNPRGRPFLFESWSQIDRAHPEAFRARAAQELVAWQCIASKVNESRGESPPMLVVPAGQMVAEVVGDIGAGRAPGWTSLDRLFADDVHLTPEGNYLIALLHYGVAYERSPVGLARSGLRPIHDAAPNVSDELAAYLQAVAERYRARTFADAAQSQRTDAQCVRLLRDLCGAQNGADHWSCRDVAERFRAVDAPVPRHEGDWCRP